MLNNVQAKLPNFSLSFSVLDEQKSTINPPKGGACNVTLVSQPMKRTALIDQQSTFFNEKNKLVENFKLPWSAGGKVVVVKNIPMTSFAPKGVKQIEQVHDIPSLLAFSNNITNYPFVYEFEGSENGTSSKLMVLAQ